jgi:hypothetical protein
MKSFVILFVLPILLTGCYASKSFVSFEILEPAAVTYPSDIKDVGFLNRAPFSKHAFPESNYDDLDSVTLMLLDTIICNNIIDGFIDGKKEMVAVYLDDMLFLESRRRDTIGQSDLIKVFEKDVLFRQNRLDGIVVLEYYILKLDKSQYLQFLEYGHVEHAEEFRLEMEILWRVYVKDSIQPLHEYLTLDTMYFYNTGNMKPEDVISTTDVIRIGSYEMGLRYGMMQVPKWTGVSRVVFSGVDKRLIAAARHTGKGEWNEAYKIWSRLLSEGVESHKLAARTLHNLSVYYELSDDVATAHEYAIKALDLWDNPFIIRHKTEMDKRIQFQSLLNKQLR